NARVLEQTFKTAGFDAAVRTLGERQLEELDARRARGEYVAPAHYVFAHVKRGNLEGALAWLPKMAEEPDWFALQMRVIPMLAPWQFKLEQTRRTTCELVFSSRPEA